MHENEEEAHIKVFQKIQCSLKSTLATSILYKEMNNIGYAY